MSSVVGWSSWEGNLGSSAESMKGGKSESVRGGAGAEGEMVAFRVGISWRRPVGDGASWLGGDVWTERVGAVDPERSGLRGATDVFGAVVLLLPPPEAL